MTERGRFYKCFKCGAWGAEGNTDILFDEEGRGRRYCLECSNDIRGITDRIEKEVELCKKRGHEEKVEPPVVDTEEDDPWGEKP